MGGWLVIIFIIAVLYYFGRGSKQKHKFFQPTQQTKLPNNLPSFNKRLTEEEFEDILAKYKTLFNAPDNDDKTLEQIANEFELKFHLRTQLYEFFNFLSEKLSNAKTLDEAKKWWPNDFINLTKFRLDGNSYSTFAISIALGNAEIQFKTDRKTHVDEFETSQSMYDPSYSDYDRSIVVKTKEVVYQLRGSDYRIDYKLPKVPRYINATIFKPSGWLLTIHNLMFDFERYKPMIEERFAKLQSENAIKKTKERFGV